MPDWFYRTVAQRVLFTLPDEAARGVALGVIGTLGKSAVGRALIEFMGHMVPDERLAVSIAGIRFASPIGLSWRVDPERRATAGLACFGVGCVEVRARDRREVRRGAGELLMEGKVISGKADRSDAGVPLLERHQEAGREWLRMPGGEDLPVVEWDRPVDRQPGDGARGVVVQVGAKNDAQAWTVPAHMPEALPEIVRAWRRCCRPVPR